jgi:hypothetical protein
MNWVVEIETGLWLATWVGDPGRTLLPQNARRYNSISSATMGLAMARRFRPFLDAKIYELNSSKPEQGGEG